MEYAELKDAIKRGLDRNILVFDALGESGELTHRLTGLLIDVYLHNREDLDTISRLTHIHVPHSIYVGDLPWRSGLEIVRWKDLNHGGFLWDYFIRELKGSLAWSDKEKHRYLVVATGTENAVLLGSVL